jgi:hypothetical protein
MARAEHQWMSIRKLVRAAGEGYAYDPGSLYDKMNTAQVLDPLPLRLLSIAGGILSAVFFTGFLFISDLLKEGLHSLITGIAFMLLSWLLPRWRNTLAFDTFAVALQAVGLVITAMGLTGLGWLGVQIAPLFAGIALLTVMVTLSKTQVFTAVIVFFASLLFWMGAAGWQDGLHLYNLLTVASVTAIMLSEANALATGGRSLWLYLPLRNGVIVACFTGFVLLAGGDGSPLTSPRFIWLSYLPVAGALLILLRHVSMELLDADRKRRRKWMIALLLLTLPTAMNPAIAASLLILLIGFYAGHRSAFVLGVLGLPLFIGMWYYDLPISLLQKSIWMMVSGATCMLTYLFLVFTNKEDAEG